MHAADVIGMAVRADDPGDVLDRAADPREVGAEHPARADVPGVDERDLVAIHQEVRLRADEPNRMNVAPASSPSGTGPGRL